MDSNSIPMYTWYNTPILAIKEKPEFRAYQRIHLSRSSAAGNVRCAWTAICFSQKYDITGDFQGYLLFLGYISDVPSHKHSTARTNRDYCILYGSTCSQDNVALLKSDLNGSISDILNLSMQMRYLHNTNIGLFCQHGLQIS